MSDNGTHDKMRNIELRLRSFQRHAGWCGPTGFVFLLTISLCGVAKAGLPHPGTWAETSDDDNFIFVMLSPLPIDEDIHDLDEEDAKDEKRWIRSTYAKSGLYRNDGSSEPLWTWDRDWIDSGVVIAPNGEHLIFPGRWIYDEYETQAVEFTRHGQTIRKYTDVDLISNYILKRILNGLASIECTGTAFNPEQMTYSIWTSQGEEFVMDVTTGEVIAVRSPFPMLFTLTAIAMLVFIALVIGWWRSRRRQSVD